jgi:NADH-ubiquinone oxidoreductase chain 2
MLLVSGISCIESTKALIFYLTQYIISNLNAFMILIAIGYALYYYNTSENKEHDELMDKNKPPIQLINQLKSSRRGSRFLFFRLSLFFCL